MKVEVTKTMVFGYLRQAETAIKAAIPSWQIFLEKPHPRNQISVDFARLRLLLDHAPCSDSVAVEVEEPASE